MIGRRSIFGLSLLSVLAFCALPTQGASAAWETATNTTAWTCVANGGKKDFNNPDCSEEVSEGAGAFGHVEIPVGTKTSIELPSVESSTVTGEILGAKVTINCKKTVVDAESESFIENTTTGGTNMDLHGTSAVIFAECTQVGNGTNCNIAGGKTFTLKAVFKGVKEPLAVPSNMAVQFEADGQPQLATIKFEGSGCLLAEAKVKGVLRGTVEGAFLTFSSLDQEVTLGGNPATFTSKLTMKMTGGGNPISITTN